jgi:glycosyltransferase involved in cell wall biosynthesis
MMKKILVLVFSDLRNDARVRRQIHALHEDYDVTVVCFNGEPDPRHKLFTIRPTPLTLIRKTITSFFLLFGFYRIAWKLLHGYDQVVRNFKDNRIDLIIANDIETLPLAFAIKPQGKVLFDAHEYAPRHFEDKFMWRVFFQRFNIWMCREYIYRVVAMMTVGKGLAREYEKNFGKAPVVITNANNYFEVVPRVTGDRIRIVHHGIATRSRNLELMIDLMDLLDDRFSLDLMLLTPGFASASTRGYIEELQAKAKHNQRIQFVPPVKSSQVVETLRSYDIGIFLLPPVNFNYANTLPNKLFDFIQARLAIAIGPTPEMAEIVNTYKNGVVSADFTPRVLANMLNALTHEDIDRMKTNSARAAAELNAEKNAERIRELVHGIIG